MQFGVTILVSILVCLFVCTCNGFPPGGLKSSMRAKFTEEEDKFIVDELSNILDGSISVYKRDVWDAIVAKHNEKRKEHTRGFSNERSSHSMRSRFKKVLLHNHPHTTVKVPETLLRKIIRAQELKLEQGGHDAHRYTKKESDFIIEELRKIASADTRLFAASTIEGIKKAHDDKRLANIAEFEHGRTHNSIRKQLYQLKQKGQLPEEIVQKFQMPQKANLPDESGASTSMSTVQTDLQERLEDLYDVQVDMDISEIYSYMDQ